MWRPCGGSLETGPRPGLDCALGVAALATGGIGLPSFVAGLAVGAAFVLLVLLARVLSSALGRAVSKRRRANTGGARARELEQQVSEQAARLAELERILADRDRALAERDRQLREAEDQAEKFVKAKSALLSRISHELRTSLNAVLGFAQLLEVENLLPPQRAHVDRILATGRQLLELVQRAVDLDQVETGHVSLSADPIGLTEIVRQVVEAAQPLAAEHHVRINADDARTAAHVRADSERLKQVLLGLCSIAIKFNREGEVVALACEVRDGGRLRIMVRNTGTGIPPGAASTLGLSRRLVEAMGGAMGTESVPGKGNTFWVEFPVAEGSEVRPGIRPEGVELPPSSQPKDRYTVLYIEDNLSNLKLVESVIRKRTRIRLISALQGRRGLELAQHHRPDLILLDLQLPDIQGDELLRRLRQNPDTRQIPVVVISADAMPAQIKRLLDGGARAYLTKPIDIAKLLALVDEILNGGPPGAADVPGRPSTIGLTGDSVASRDA